ncbi:MAG: hypothetical protein ACRYHQ_36640 [Janthinobacterium lividum]
MLGLVPVLCLLLALPALAQPVACDPSPQQGCQAGPEAALLPFWIMLPDQASWQMLVTPAFPQSWPAPLAGRGAVVGYAFARRLKPGVVDGAEMAAPWARLTMNAEGVQRVERLSPTLQPAGPAGGTPARRRGDRPCGP